jgi:hypothetical protein
MIGTFQRLELTFGSFGQQYTASDTCLGYFEQAVRLQRLARHNEV